MKTLILKWFVFVIMGRDAKIITDGLYGKILKATHRLWSGHPFGTLQRLVDSSSAEAHIVTLSRLWSIPLLSYFYTQPLSAQLQCVFFVASSIFYLEAVFSGQSHKNKTAKRVHLCTYFSTSSSTAAMQSVLTPLEGSVMILLRWDWSLLAGGDHSAEPRH